MYLKKRGIYIVDVGNCIENGKPKNDGILQKMIDEKIILKIFSEVYFDLDEVDKSLSSPYYLFKQDYSPTILQECKYSPKYPVKFEQLPLNLQKKVIKLPIKFSQTHQFQIAEWHLCNVSYSEYSDDTIIIDGCRYALLPLSNGTDAYIKISIIEESGFYNYCSQRKFYGCNNCWDDCYSCNIWYHSENPTVLFVRYLIEDNKDHLPQSISKYAIEIPILPRVPIKMKNGQYRYTISGYHGFESEKEIKESVSPKTLSDLIAQNYKWLVDTVFRFKPNVILLSDKAQNTLKSIWGIENNKIEIDGVIFPTYLLSEYDANSSEIEWLSKQPYRGKQFPHIISIEDMNKIKEKLRKKENQKNKND